MAQKYGPTARWNTALSTLLLVAIIIATPQTALADCGHDGVVVEGTDSERVATCAALREVIAYFGDIGFNISPVFRLVFMDSVFIDLHNPNANTISRKMQVSGFFDAGKQMIQVTSGSSQFREGRRPWGVPWNEEIAYSILRHELVHMATEEIDKNSKRKLSKVWREYIAYCVQMDLMTPALRAKITNNYYDAQPFEYPERVNDMIYSFDPDLFGVKAHLYTGVNGGKAFIRRILIGDVLFDTGDIMWVK